MTELEKEVIEVVLAYTEAKTLWENAMMLKKLESTPEKMEQKPYDYFKGFDMKQYTGLTKEEIRAKYESFFSQYATPKKRVYGGGASASFGFPAAYQGLSADDISAVDFVNEKRCEVTCKIPTGFKQTLKFVVMKKQNIWLLDSVKSYSKSDDKWSNSIL